MGQQLACRSQRFAGLVFGAVLALACSNEIQRPSPGEAEDTAPNRSTLSARGNSIGNLPWLDAGSVTQTYLQRLGSPTRAGDNAVLHVKLPSPSNERLRASLLRVVGEPSDPVLLFRTDALLKLGILPTSPGPDFFSALLKFEPAQFDERGVNEVALAKGAFGPATREAHLFDNRHLIGRRDGVHVDNRQFIDGDVTPLGACLLRPTSNLAAWEKSLLIRDPSVVLDASRTWDPCSGAGTPGGVWTFAHLMREMAQGSGVSAEQFVWSWLSNWLAPSAINGELPDRHRASSMLQFFILPWAAASGVTVTWSCSPPLGPCSATLSGPLNLDIAPFRLMAIVNRVDLGNTVSGPGGYGGGITTQPVDAGELRFVFSAVQPNPWGAGTEASCGISPFNVIFEYGVPVTGCRNVASWAQRWTELNTFSGFTADYLTQLQAITESVVLHGAAPSKGNQNALNQLRTNEIALSDDWELREFRLTTENPSANTDTPSDGLLRPHTVAQTPNRNNISIFFPQPLVDSFVQNVVVPSVASPVGPLPDHCDAAYTLPYSYLGSAFRGAHAVLVGGHLEVTSAVTAREICARHLFSLNTCNGCHMDDTATSFTHVEPGHIPAGLSDFLTGAGTGGTFLAVPGTQFLTPVWRFNDLDRRFQRLYDLAFCTECGFHAILRPDALAKIATLGGVVPIDPLGPVSVKFRIGPITDLATLAAIYKARDSLVSGARVDVPVDFVRRAETISD